MTEFAAQIAIKHRERIIQRSMGYVEKGLAAARTFCSAREDLFRWREPLAGSVCFPELRIEGGPWRSASDFCEEAAVKAGLMLLAQRSFQSSQDWQPGSADVAFRIGLGRARTPELLARLSTFVSNHG